MTSELQTDRYSQMVRRVGAMIGPGGRVVEVLTELFPVIELEGTTPEILALGGWRTAWQSTERPAAPGMVSRSQLFNPADSGIIAAVTQVWWRSAIAGAIQMAIENAQIGGTPVRGLFRDARFGGNRETSLTVEAVDAGAVGGGFFFRDPGAVNTQMRDDNGIVVLLPGSGLSVGAGAQNSQLTVNYFWRERSAEQSEINF